MFPVSFLVIENELTHSHSNINTANSINNTKCAHNVYSNSNIYTSNKYTYFHHIRTNCHPYSFLFNLNLQTLNSENDFFLKKSSDCSL